MSEVRKAFRLMLATMSSDELDRIESQMANGYMVRSPRHYGERRPRRGNVWKVEECQKERARRSARTQEAQP